MWKNGVDHQDNKFPIDVVQVLIPFKEGHLGQLKLHLREGVLVLEKKEGIFFEVEEKRMGGSSETIEIFYLMALQKKGRRILMRTNLEGNRLKKLYSEM